MCSYLYVLSILVPCELLFWIDYDMAIGVAYSLSLGKKWVLRVARCETTLLKERSSVWIYAIIFNTIKNIAWS